MFLGPFSPGCGQALLLEGGAGGDLTGLTPKLYLLPPLPTCLPWPIPSFWYKAMEQTLDKVMPRNFGFALFLQNKLLSKLADCISPNYQCRHPAPCTRVATRWSWVQPTFLPPAPQDIVCRQ